MDAGSRTGRGFTIIDHPSDVGVHAWGATLSEAYEEAAAGMLSLIVDGPSVHAAEERTVTLSSADAEQLLVQWLSELLYLYDGEHFITAAATIDRLSHTRLHATIAGERADARRHHWLTDIKAVTYHQLAVDETHHAVRVFFDV